MVLIKGGQMKQKIIKPGVVRRIAEKIADEGINPFANFSFFRPKL